MKQGKISTMHMKTYSLSHTHSLLPLLSISHSLTLSLTRTFGRRALAPVTVLSKSYAVLL